MAQMIKGKNFESISLNGPFSWDPIFISIPYCCIFSHPIVCNLFVYKMVRWSGHIFFGLNHGYIADAALTIMILGYQHQTYRVPSQRCNRQRFNIKKTWFRSKHDFDADVILKQTWFWSRRDFGADVISEQTWFWSRWDLQQPWFSIITGQQCSGDFLCTPKTYPEPSNSRWRIDWRWQQQFNSETTSNQIPPCIYLSCTAGRLSLGKFHPFWASCLLWTVGG